MFSTFAPLIFCELFLHGDATSAVDCRFDQTTNDIDAGEFCDWHLYDNHDHSSIYIWQTGDAVIVDAANFVTRDTSDDKSNDDIGLPGPYRNRFAYAQGGHGALTAAALESPNLPPTVSVGGAELSLVYWKLAPLPALDICIHEIGASADALNCVDTVAGPGQQQWIRRIVELPPVSRPYTIILRARDLLSAEDIICVDDIRLTERHKPNRHAPLRDASSNALVHGYRFTHERQAQQRYSDDDEEHISEKSYDKADLDDAKIHAADFVGQSLELLRTTSVGVSNGGVPRQRPSAIRPQTRRLFTVLHRSAATAAAVPWRPKTTVAEPAPSSCPAVKCTFLDNACAWTLGNGWRKSEAVGITCETSGEYDARNAPFKAPFGSLFEFDMWMSDNAVFTVTQEDVPLQLVGVLPPPPAPPAIFTYSGASGVGFRRFRVPLRPSFLPVRLRLRCQQPAGAFVAVANTQLVDSRADEIPCDNASTVANPLKAFSDSFLTTLPSFPTLIPPLNSAPATVMPAIPFAAVTVATGAPIFNSFQPMLESGMAPIVPIKSHPTRLTALQKSAENTLSDDSHNTEKMLYETNKLSTVRRTNDPIEYGIKSTKDNIIELNNNKVDDNKLEPIPYVNLNRGRHATARASGDRIRPVLAEDDRIRPTSVEQRDTPPTAVDGTDSSVLETFIHRLTGGQPHLDRQLMQLAKRFGVSALPRDSATLDAIGTMLGGQREGGASWPTSSQLAALLPLLSGSRSAVQSLPPPSPFGAPEA